MIGQSEATFNESVSIADVAAWMNVSKPTARKHILAMVGNGELVGTRSPYKNTFIWSFKLTRKVFQDYMDKRLIREYHTYAQKVMGIILQ